MGKLGGVGVMGGEHGGTIVRSVGTSGGPVIEHREPSGNGSGQWVGWGGAGGSGM